MRHACRAWPVLPRCLSLSLPPLLLARWCQLVLGRGKLPALLLGSGWSVKTTLTRSIVEIISKELYVGAWWLGEMESADELFERH